MTHLPSRFAATIAATIGVVVLALVPALAQDANRYLLEYPGVTGSVELDPPGPGNTLVGQIDLLSVSFGADRAVARNIADNEANIGGLRFSRVECLMKIDSAAVVDLWREAISGDFSTESAVVRAFTDTDPGPAEVMGKAFELDLEGAVISSFEQRGSDGDEAIIKIAIDFTKVTMTSFDSEGAVSGTYSWNVSTNLPE